MSDFRFLTVPEMEHLTGAICKQKQCEHLQFLDIPYMLNRKGQPIVLIADLKNNERKHTGEEIKW